MPLVAGALAVGTADAVVVPEADAEAVRDALGPVFAAGGVVGSAEGGGAVSVVLPWV